MSIKLDDYEVINIIGSGSFGTCYKVRNKHTNDFFVWKAIDYGSMTEGKKKLLVSEVNLLSELNHPHIVRYYHRILHKETTTLYIIMEWCQGGDLASIIKQHRKSGSWLGENFIWRVMYQTGRALQACHTRLGQVTILHRDIKPANVFLDANGNVKLGDFGLARVLEGEDAYSSTMVGTPYYMSPEVMKGTKYNRKSDIWALGCLVYELCTLAPPFDGTDIHDLANNIKLGRFNRIPEHFSDNLVKIIKLMLTVKHEFRPTIEMILHHPVVVSNISKIMKMKNSSDLDKNHKTEERKLEEVIQVSLVDKEPGEVSKKAFEQKWFARLLYVRKKEAILREREEGLVERERLIVKKEKQINLLEREAKEKICRAEVYLHQCRDNKLANHKYHTGADQESSFSADPGDTSLEPTTAKVLPNMLQKPQFVKSYSERKQKHVHFHTDVANRPERVLRPDNRQNIIKQQVGTIHRQEGPLEHVFSEFGIIERRLNSFEQEKWAEHKRVLNYSTRKYVQKPKIEKENKDEKHKRNSKTSSEIFF